LNSNSNQNHNDGNNSNEKVLLEIYLRYDYPQEEINSFEIELLDFSEPIQNIDKINFHERLDIIEATVQETIKQLDDIKKETLEELQKASEAIYKTDFDGKFDNLQKEISVSVKSNNELSEAIEKQKLGEKIEEFERLISKRIHESYKEVTKNTNEIATNTAKTIQDLNLPIRIDKLDANISGILTAIQNIQGRLDIVERNFGDKLKDTADRQAVLLSDISNKLAAVAKKQQTNSYITWAIIIICCIVSILILK
jgi:translation elongation factor EF-G